LLFFQNWLSISSCSHIQPPNPCARKSRLQKIDFVVSIWKELSYQLWGRK
jgi:hypothetical protein